MLDRANHAKSVGFWTKSWIWDPVRGFGWVWYTPLSEPFSCFEVHFGLQRRYFFAKHCELWGNSSRDIIKWFKTIENTQRHPTVMLDRANHAKSYQKWTAGWWKSRIQKAQMVNRSKIQAILQAHTPKTVFLTGLRSLHGVLSMIFGFLVKFWL